jgi:type I restriction enzyme, S subunit
LVHPLRVIVPSLPQQQAIAQVLRTVQRAKEATEKVIAAARCLKQSLMRHLFTYGPIPLHDADRVELQETKAGIVPRHWEVGRFCDQVSITSGQVDPKREPYLDQPHVGPENIEEGTGRILNVRTPRELGLISGKYAFNPGDILYSKIRPYLRKAALPDFDGVCSADMYPLQPKVPLTREFLFQWLLSDTFTTQAVSFQSRTGIPKINRQQLDSTWVPLPTDIEQTTIAGYLSVMDVKLGSEMKRRDSLASLFDSLLHNLLTGRVRLTAIALPVLVEAV